MTSTRIHSDAKATVAVSSRRFEQSPYFDLYANEQTVLGVYAGRYYPADNGEDPVATYWRLRRHAVLYDVPESPWQIEGPDSLELLELVFARRIGDLPENRGRYAIACTPTGGTFMDEVLFKLEENRYWYVQPDGALRAWLVAHSTGLDVDISDPRSRVLQIQGPNAMKIMSDLTSGAIDTSMRYFHSGFFGIGGQRLYVSRTGWTGELGYEIYSDSSTNHARLWDDVIAAGEPHDMVFGSTTSMGTRRIEAAILDNLTDFVISMTPFQAGLGDFIGLDKEALPGRDALTDADRRPLLLGLTCPDGTPATGGAVSDNRGPVARVTAATWSPTLECGIGYARFNAAGDWIGCSLTVVTERGDSSLGEVVALPFFDPHKRIPRGQDTPEDGRPPRQIGKT